MSMVKVFMLGRITQDIEEKTTNSGKSVCSFNVAVDDKFDKERTHFIPCVAWGKTCQHIAKWFKKGSMIAIDGKLQSRAYQANDGTNRTVVEVVVENVSFTGERKKESTEASHTPAPENRTQANFEPVTGTQQEFARPSSDFEDVEDDDLPF